jgi:hemerythrin superfamily protein
VDAINLLIADHNRTKGLFARYHEAQEQDRDDDVAGLAAKIVIELTVHTSIEEDIFYPFVHGMSEELAEQVDEGVQEHHVVKVLLDEIGDLEAGTADWVAKMTVVIESVEHHVEEEEGEMFPKVRSHSSLESREEIGRLLERKKRGLGAPISANKGALSKDELMERAREQEIPGRSSMDRAELEATVAID